jgi:hypothetical protein
VLAKLLENGWNVADKREVEDSSMELESSTHMEWDKIDMDFGHKWHTAAIPHKWQSLSKAFTSP